MSSAFLPILGICGVGVWELKIQILCRQLVAGLRREPGSPALLRIDYTAEAQAQAALMAKGSEDFTDDPVTCALHMF